MKNLTGKFHTNFYFRPLCLIQLEIIDNKMLPLGREEIQFGQMISEQMKEKIEFLYPIFVNAGAVLISVGLFIFNDCQLSLVSETVWIVPTICVILFIINIFFWLKTSLTDPGVLPAGLDRRQVVEISRQQLLPRTEEVR